MTAMNRPAALAVCTVATDVEDAKMLLEALGIWPVSMQYSTYVILHPNAPRTVKLEAAKKAPRPAPEPRIYLPCGTTAAYRRHLRLAEKPCTECKAAAAKYRLDRKVKP